MKKNAATATPRTTKANYIIVWTDSKEKDHYISFRAGEHSIKEIKRQYNEINDRADTWSISLTKVIESTDY